MPTLCVQCALRALVEDRTVETFEETPEEHTRTHHPDPVQTVKEREELERRLTEKMRFLR